MTQVSEKSEKTLYVLGVAEHLKTSVRLDRELAASIRSAAAAHPVNGPLADAIDELLDQGLDRAPAYLDVRDVSSDLDSEVVERDGKVYFVTEEDGEVLVTCPRLCPEPFFLPASYLELATLTG